MTPALATPVAAPQELADHPRRKGTPSAMHGLDLANTAIFVGAALVLIGIFSSLVATRFGAPLLLVFLVVGMLAGEDGPGGIVFNDYRATYLVGVIALSVILFDGGLRTRLAVFRGIFASSMLLATVGVLVTAAIAALAAWAALGFGPVEALLLGAIIGSTDAAAVFFLLRTGGLRLPGRVGASAGDRVRHQRSDRGVPDDRAHRVHPRGRPDDRLGARVRPRQGGGARRRMGILGGFALVAMLNRLALPGGLHPLFVVAVVILVSTFTALIGGSGLLAVYVAGLVMANRPTRAYPSIVGFHDAVTWLCQIVMFLALGLLVTPTELWDYAPQGLFVAFVLTFVARPVAVALCLGPFAFPRREKLFIAWVGLRGAVSIFLAAIPTLAGVPNGAAYFNIAFFVVLFSMLVQGGSLTRAARRLGVALKTAVPPAQRVEIDVPGQTEQEIVGYPVTADSLILGLSSCRPGRAS